jgi:hypothetical protein
VTAAGVLLAAALGALAQGCNPNLQPRPTYHPMAASQPVGQTLGLLLPQKIRIHPFTGTRTFSQQGGIKGFDVRIEATDAFGDATKAIGSFRFELYSFKGDSADPKGQRLAVWNIDVGDFDSNRSYWNGITRTYQFKLGWDEPVPVGRKLVLVAVFQSPYTPRLMDEHLFVAGQ